MHSLAELPRLKARVRLLPREAMPDHELQSHRTLADRVAVLLGLPAAGNIEPDLLSPGEDYLIPSDTLIGPDDNKRFGINTPDDFFGGWVAEPFMATKAISHPLFDSDSLAPAGWNPQFGLSTNNAVLRGYTAFSIKDAHHAAQQLLQNGPLRIKAVCARAGRGQTRIEDNEQLAQALALIDEAEIAIWGLTLEEDLQRVMTLSIGQAEVADMLISYVGTQQLARNNLGEQVYGGSRLTVVRGDYPALLRLPLSERIRMAIAQARIYEATAYHCFPGLLASRRNYDVAQGFTHAGEFRSGVLEQSWRIGGASGAEILAMEKFFHDESLTVVRANTREVYGACRPPEEVCILYRGDDPDVGPITKYAELFAYDDSH